MPFLSISLMPFITAFVISFLSAPISIFVAKRLKLIDDPSKNKHPKVIHKKPTARGGVLGIFFAVIISVLLFLPFDHHIKGILAGGLILTILGLADDRYNINPYIRIVVLIIAAGMPIIGGIGIAFINNPLSGGILDLSNPRITFELLGGLHSVWILSDFFALIWIVAIMNFMNMGAKGLPGQMPGVAGIAAITILLLSFKFSADIAEWPVTILAAVTAGAFLGFLPWNMYPQKIMPGFGGSTLAGYLLAILAILTTTKVGTLFLVLSVPVIDTLLTMLVRIKNGKSPVWGDRGHLHHKLLDMGWSQQKTTYFYWLMTALLGVIAITVTSENKLYTILSIGIVLVIFILWFTIRSKRQKI